MTGSCEKQSEQRWRALRADLELAPSASQTLLRFVFLVLSTNFLICRLLHEFHTHSAQPKKSEFNNSDSNCNTLSCTFLNSSKRILRNLNYVFFLFFSVFLLFCFVLLLTQSYFIALPGLLKFIMQTRIFLNSQYSSCLFLLVLWDYRHVLFLFK